MTTDQEKQLNDHIERVASTARNTEIGCPFCGGQSFSYGEIVKVELPLQGQMRRLAPEARPGTFAQLVCESCGYVMLFDVEIAKVKVD